MKVLSCCRRRLESTSGHDSEDEAIRFLLAPHTTSLHLSSQSCSHPEAAEPGAAPFSAPDQKKQPVFFSLGGLQRCLELCNHRAESQRWEVCGGVRGENTTSAKKYTSLITTLSIYILKKKKKLPKQHKPTEPVVWHPAATAEAAANTKTDRLSA